MVYGKQKTKGTPKPTSAKIYLSIALKPPKTVKMLRFEHHTPKGVNTP